MSHRDSKEEINENEFLNLENIEFDVKKEKNCLPSFLLESLNENDYDNYFKDELSTDEINNSTEEEKKEKSNFNYKMHSFDDSKKIKIDLPKNINLNYNFTPSNQFICSNNYNEIFNNQILNSKQYSFNNKNSNVNRLYQQFFQIPNNYCSQQINPQLHMPEPDFPLLISALHILLITETSRVSFFSCFSAVYLLHRCFLLS